MKHSSYSFFQDSVSSWSGFSGNHTETNSGNTIFPWLKADESIHVDFESYDDEFAKKKQNPCRLIFFAPLWLKVLIVLSAVSFTFSIVFITVVKLLTRPESIYTTPRASIENSSLEDPSSSPSDDMNKALKLFSLSPSTISSDSPTYGQSTKPSNSPSKILSHPPSFSSTPSPSNSPTSSPTSSPTDSPTSSPTNSSTSSPTDFATSSPTNSSTISLPTITLTDAPTASPTFVTSHSSPAPSISIQMTSEGPSTLISHHPTKNTTSTASPTYHPSLSNFTSSLNASSFSTKTSFFVMGDKYRQNRKSDVINEMENLSPDGQFTVHLGDFNNVIHGCNMNSYIEFRDFIVQHMPVPTFVTPGDNELNDCPDPQTAWTYWRSFISNIDTEWSHPSFEVFRQVGQEENFAFYLQSVLYVGLNVVGGVAFDRKLWRKQLRMNARWIRNQMSLHESQGVEALVIFGHDDNIDKHEIFFSALSKNVKEFDIPTVYIHESNNSSEVRTNVLNTTKLWFASIEGGTLPFAKVTVDTSLPVPFVFDLN